MTPATVQVPLMALGKWVVMAVGVGILMAIARQLRHADSGDEDNDTGRLAQPPDDGHVDNGPEGQPQDESDHEPHPERHVILHDQQREDGGADDAHVADGEIDDAGGPVDRRPRRRR